MLSVGLTLQSAALWAQAGELSFTTPTTNPLTGVTSFNVNWMSINLSEPAKALIIEFGISGIEVCVQPLTFDPASIHPEFVGYVSQTGKSSFRIRKWPPEPFPLQSQYVPLMRVYFRAAPGTTVTLQSTLGVVWAGNNFYQIDLPDPVQVTMPNPFLLSGIIRKLPGSTAQCAGGQNAGITNVDVTFRANTPCYPGTPSNPFTILSLDGSYGAWVPSHYSYTITPYKNSSCACGLDDGDVNVIRNIILGIIENPTLGQLIAGDFNASGTVTTFDIVNILQCRYGSWTPPSGWSAWRFISEDDYDYYNQPPINIPNLNSLPSSIVTPIILGNNPTLDFYGIKRGDVDGSCSNCNQQFTEDEPALRSNITAWLAYPKTPLYAGTVFDALVMLNENTPSAATLSLSLGYDSESIEVIDVEPVGLSDEFWEVWRSEEKPSLRLFWMSMSPDGQDLTKGEKLLRIRAQAKKTIEQPELLFWQLEPRSDNLYFNNGASHSAFQLSAQGASDVFWVRMIGPNPTRDKTDLMVTVPNDTDMEILIYNARGILLSQNRYTLMKGTHQLTLNSLPDLPGTYTVLARTAWESRTLRVVKF
ncbi:MAG: T9SS type A sorting domain-containing protein [Saprospiraceae bacterium]|nr:T9SS type A sorting domain-containing protein [Saprospiraceae bacterium]MDW8231046.1 T9SS type A sorting domain-containing protein [Saprospiraceae bacterium]